MFVRIVVVFVVLHFRFFVGSYYLSSACCVLLLSFFMNLFITRIISVVLPGLLCFCVDLFLLICLLIFCRMICSTSCYAVFDLVIDNFVFVPFLVSSL